MSNFKEPIKKLESIRYYISNFHIYGIKSREEFEKKSLRSYDNEKRRTESILGEYISYNRTVNGKNIYISMDSKNILSNPFHKVFKIKTFTKNDVNLHYILIDILKDNIDLKISEIIEIMEEEYLEFFDNYSTLDVKTVRLKLNNYVDKGIFTKQTIGKDVIYNYKKQDVEVNEDSINFFTMYSPIGVIGSYFNFKNSFLTFKHEYIFHALDSEIIYNCLCAIYNKHYINVVGYDIKRGNDYIDKMVPVKIMVSTQGGRCYLHCFSLKKGAIRNIRIDRIHSVELLDECLEFNTYLHKSAEKRKNMWGAAIKDRVETVKITLSINSSEKYILERLEKEKRNGTITKIGDELFSYETNCYDAMELLPWIRSFTCRIVKLESSCNTLVKTFYNDLNSMYEMYGDNYDI